MTADYEPRLIERPQFQILATNPKTDHSSFTPNHFRFVVGSNLQQ
jgi:hypothetical protein